MTDIWEEREWGVSLHGGETDGEIYTVFQISSVSVLAVCSFESPQPQGLPWFQGARDELCILLLTTEAMSVIIAASGKLVSAYHVPGVKLLDL